MAAKPDTLIRALALTAGLAVSALALLAWRVPASERTLGTDVAVRAVKPGELSLDPPGASPPRVTCGPAARRCAER